MFFWPNQSTKMAKKKKGSSSVISIDSSRLKDDRRKNISLLEHYDEEHYGFFGTNYFHTHNFASFKKEKDDESKKNAKLI